MFDAVLLSQSSSAPLERLPRARGAIRLEFKRRGAGTALDRFYQQGAARVRLPRQPAGEPPLAILLNMAGGVTGGDRFSSDVRLQPATAAIVTSQAAERAYRSAGGAATIENRIELQAGARLDWLPQETILFDRSHLERRLVVDLAPGARFLGVEAIVLGRRASGETVRQAQLQDSWRIRRGGRLIFADGLRLDGDVAASTARAAVFGGATAMATLVLVAEEAEGRLDEVRRLFADLPAESGASAWNGMLVARFLAVDGFELRQSLMPVLSLLHGARPLPRPWYC
ncbi:urease accessory protein UreD [Hypericibacter adhaerens]|uniref:Urease accessory protein UreD n=1 Tax=Hypericibacter adhaerens TaxID=2602016 RepID=A0A5J6MZA1_9PROT|nr:urease accessory protein UreD [Hypericibacter adhaerens]QEX22859.1 urease accessory protein UreD [Hypericibacter adhaerens]